MSTSKNFSQQFFGENSESAILICAFSGWNDAGNAAVDAIDYLNRQLQATPLPAFDVTPYYNFTQTRPLLSHVAGTPIIEWPCLTVHEINNAGRRILTLTAEEPQLAWPKFVQDLFIFAAKHNVKSIILLGALLGENPHTRPFPVSVTSYSEELRESGIEIQTYSGPTGIVGVLAAGAAQARLQDLSIWVDVPHYAGHSPQPKATYELVKTLNSLLDIATDLTVLEEEKEAWERGAEELLQEEPELARYVQHLETQVEEDDVTGEDIAAAFEQYLKGKE